MRENDTKVKFFFQTRENPTEGASPLSAHAFRHLQVRHVSILHSNSSRYGMSRRKSDPVFSHKSVIS